jgi:predicted alpha/beta hydrolase
MADAAGEESSELLESTLRIRAADGAEADLQIVRPHTPPRASVLWLPALGVPARNYLAFARALAEHGIAVALHEWRGCGSSDRRASRNADWGYRELLALDVPASRVALQEHIPDVPFWLGGHSLGGQFAALSAALDARTVAGLALVATGSPYWRQFGHAWLIRLFYAVVPLISKVCGHFPGRTLGFGGREARGVMADWARSGRSGRYAASGMAEDFEAHLAGLHTPIVALRLADDWLGPAASLEWLLRKMPLAPAVTGIIRSVDLSGAPADHFAWMKTPAAVASRLSLKIID